MNLLAQRQCSACSRYYSPKFGRDGHCASCSNTSKRERLRRQQDAGADAGADPGRRRYLAARDLRD